MGPHLISPHLSSSRSVAHKAARKNGTHWEKRVTLLKSQNRKNLTLRKTLGKINHTWKIGHSWKNGSPLEKWITLGKMGHTRKKGGHTWK